MGYFYDWLENRWVPIDHGRRLTPAQRRQIERHRQLVTDLITEVQKSRGEIRLYASLLVRALVSSEELLMGEFGRQVAQLSPEGGEGKSRIVEEDEDERRLFLERRRELFGDEEQRWPRRAIR